MQRITALLYFVLILIGQTDLDNRRLSTRWRKRDNKTAALMSSRSNYTNRCWRTELLFVNVDFDFPALAGLFLFRCCRGLGVVIHFAHNLYFDARNGSGNGGNHRQRQSAN